MKLNQIWDAKQGILIEADVYVADARRIFDLFKMSSQKDCEILKKYKNSKALYLVDRKKSVFIYIADDQSDLEAIRSRVPHTEADIMPVTELLAKLETLKNSANPEDTRKYRKSCSSPIYVKTK